MVLQYQDADLVVFNQGLEFSHFSLSSFILAEYFDVPNINLFFLSFYKLIRSCFYYSNIIKSNSDAFDLNCSFSKYSQDFS